MRKFLEDLEKQALAVNEKNVFRSRTAKRLQEKFKKPLPTLSANSVKRPILSTNRPVQAIKKPMQIATDNAVNVSDPISNLRSSSFSPGSSGFASKPLEVFSETEKPEPKKDNTKKIIIVVGVLVVIVIAFVVFKKLKKRKNGK